MDSNLTCETSVIHAHGEMCSPECICHRANALAKAQGEVRSVSSTGGEKGVKEERFSLIPVEALEVLAALYGRGAQKYAEHNWRQGYEFSKSYDALQRHANAFWRGENNDQETGKPHMASVIFHAMALIIFMEEHPEFDDRYKKD